MFLSLLHRHLFKKISGRKSHNHSDGLPQIFIYVVGKTTLALANRFSIAFDNRALSRTVDNVELKECSNGTLSLFINKDLLHFATTIPLPPWVLATWV
ncbi:hypothetical protein CMV_018820 [Castanea mollissima]|uniref:Uncharacterized protein n=1 Tax=Castanea mollissima TaxID=60419 RepID=A0A8J4QM37_9ROSI|nr:hypothetical protein CMV_018820 [Castanea mollissima]